MIGLDKCSGSCNSVDDLSTKICVPSKTEGMNVKVFNMITNKNEAKATINVTVNANSTVQLAIQIKNGIIINANASVKSIVRVKKIIVGILANIFVRIASF